MDSVTNEIKKIAVFTNEITNLLELAQDAALKVELLNFNHGEISPTDYVMQRKNENNIINQMSSHDAAAAVQLLKNSLNYINSYLEVQAGSYVSQRESEASGKRSRD